MPLTGVSLAFAAMQGTLLFLTFYYQIVRGWSPLQAGLLVLPFAVGQLLGAPRSAKMVNRFGARVVITVGLGFALAGMLCFAFLSPDAPIWFLVVVGVVFGFGLGNTIAPSTTRMTLATPPERSGSGSAVQNTVRQVGAVFGVAILSSVVGTVYGNNIGPALADKGLPPEALTAATDSIGGTNEVADRLAASGAVPAPVVEQLRQVANDAFMPALHTAAFVSAGLLLIAIAVIVLRLPTKAETVAWAGSGPGSPGAGSGQPPENGAAPAAAAQSTVDKSQADHSTADHSTADHSTADHSTPTLDLSSRRRTTQPMRVRACPRWRRQALGHNMIRTAEHRPRGAGAMPRRTTNRWSMVRCRRPSRWAGTPPTGTSTLTRIPTCMEVCGRTVPARGPERRRDPPVGGTRSDCRSARRTRPGRDRARHPGRAQARPPA